MVKGEIKRQLIQDFYNKMKSKNWQGMNKLDCDVCRIFGIRIPDKYKKDYKFN